MSEIQAICFDGFGTLVEITDKRRPFQALLAHETSLASTALTRPLGLRELSRELAIATGEARLAELEADLEVECASTRLRPGMDLVWASLRRQGLKIGLCSNLAAPYEQALLACLPGIPDALVLSFQVGMMKPDSGIYRLVCAKLNLQPPQVLFVGDSLEADVLGPRAAGLFAMPIDEFEANFANRARSAAPRQVAELFERIKVAGEDGEHGGMPLMHSPEQALDSGLFHVNVSTPRRYTRCELLQVLRSPYATMEGSDYGLRHLLHAFIDEADESLLSRVAEGREITWANLWHAAQAGLRSTDPKLAWIAGRAIKSGVSVMPAVLDALRKPTGSPASPATVIAALRRADSTPEHARCLFNDCPAEVLLRFAAETGLPRDELQAAYNTAVERYGVSNPGFEEVLAGGRSQNDQAG